MTTELTSEQALYFELLTLSDAAPREVDEATLALIRRGLTADHEPTREAAQDVIDVVADEAFVPLLMELATDEELAPEIRADAVIAFGPLLEAYDDAKRWGEEDVDDALFAQARATLVTLYRDPAAPKEVRRRAVEAAVRGVPEDWSGWVEDAVRAAWASDDLDWRVTAVFCMGQRTGFEGELREALEADAPELLREALRAAGNVGLAEAAPRAMAAAADPQADRWVRVAAVIALGQLAPDGAEALLERLERDPDEQLSAAAAEALMELGMAAELEGGLAMETPGEDDEEWV